MSTMTKFKNYRLRRNQELAHRAITHRQINSRHDVAKAEMMVYTNRIW